MIIIGKHAVQSRIDSGQPIDKIFIKKRKQTPRDIQNFVQYCRQKKISVTLLAAYDFDQRFSQASNQGIAALVPEVQYATLDKVISKKPPVVICLDHIQDPHNMGAICRTIEAFGIDSVFFPKDRAAQITPTVTKAAAGALDQLHMIRVTNLRQTCRTLKKNGYWIYAASSNEGQSIEKIEFQFPMVLICGSEHKGVSPGLVKEIDEMITIPMDGKTSSLNVSVATGIIVHRISTQFISKT